MTKMRELHTPTNGEMHPPVFLKMGPLSENLANSGSIPQYFQHLQVIYYKSYLTRLNYQVA